MNKSARNRIWFLFVFLFFCKASFAQAPSGTLTLGFSNSTIPLIDLTGVAFEPQNQFITGVGDNQTPFSFSSALIITNTGSGKIIGSSAGITLQIGDGGDTTDYVPVTSYKVTGSITGGGKHLTRVQMTVTLAGDGPVKNVDTPFRMVVHYDLLLNLDDWALEGTARGTASFQKLGTSGKIRSDVVFPLPGDPAGAWTATLNVAAFKKLTGSGTITLPVTGRTIQGNLSGTFSEHSNISKIKFTGIFDAKGSTATFYLTPNEEGGFDVQAVRGRILGQTVLD
jgi:hypothetical protein